MLPTMIWLLACQNDIQSGDTHHDSVSDQTTQDTDESNSDSLSEDDEGCINDADYFEQKVWGEALSPVCYSCHNSTGAARYSDLVLQSNVLPGYLEANRGELEYVSILEIDDVPLVLRKPLGLNGHGGGAVITEESAAFTALEGFVDRLENPVESCPGDEDIRIESSDLVLATPKETLRKVTLNLLGTLPSQSHLAKVEQQGEAGLERVLTELLSGVEFGYPDNTKQIISNRLVTLWNDLLLTDKYMSGQQAIQSTDYDKFLNLYWYNVHNDPGNERRNKVNGAIAREPLELMRHVFLEDLHWGTILTADYTMMNSWSAMSYGVSDERFVSPDLDDPQSDVFYPVTIDAHPQVGILSTVTFMNRYPTTDTNRNRHRAKVFYEYFLNTNILSLADRPIDADNSAIHNPTMNDPQCNVCHSVMEPVSGAFQNWDNDGHYNPPETGWHAEMYEPGFGGETISITESGDALRWLAEKVYEDPRFARSTVEQVFHAFTGLDVLKGYEWSTDSVEYQAWRQQDAFFNRVSNEFMTSGWDIKIPIREVLLSKFYRAVDHEEASESELLMAGTARLLTPEELHQKILTVTGYEWGDELIDDYRLLYGGIDSNDVVTRLRVPNGVIGAIALRMANSVACKATSTDFILPRNQRRLFPYVETSYQPYTDDGFEIPEVQERIKQTIQHLFYRVLGQEVRLNDPEVLAVYDLWVDMHAEGKMLLESGVESTYMTYACRGFEDPNTGVDVPSEHYVLQDPEFTIRAWRGVMVYLLSDYHFLFE